LGYQPTKATKVSTRAEYATRLFVTDRIDLDEFERRLDLLLTAGKDKDPYIIDAGPNGFKDPTK
jgi:hypothetical protein